MTTYAYDSKTGAFVGEVLHVFVTGLVAIRTKYGYKTAMTSTRRTVEV